jgi:hypothetical protein
MSDGIPDGRRAGNGGAADGPGKQDGPAPSPALAGAPAAERPAVELAYRLGPQEMQEALGWYWSRLGTMRTMRLTAVAVTVLTLGGSVLQWRTGHHVPTMEPLFGVVLFLAVFVFFPVQQRKQARRTADRIGELHTLVDASGVTVRSSLDAVTHRPWPSHSGYAETPALFLLVARQEAAGSGEKRGDGKRGVSKRNPTEMVPLPKHAVDRAIGLDAFRAVLDRHLTRM